MAVALAVTGTVGYLLLRPGPGPTARLVVEENVSDANGSYFTNVTIGQGLGDHLLVLSISIDVLDGAPCGTSGFAPDWFDCTWYLNNTTSGVAPFGGGLMPENWTASIDGLAAGTFELALHAQYTHGVRSVTVPLHFDALVKVIDLGLPTSPG